MRVLGINESLLGLAALSLAACGYDNGSGYRYVDQVDENPPIYTANIDADATIEDVAAGQGVGMLIEYFTGGTWKIQFVCDTAITNMQCSWSINMQSLDGSPLGGVDQQQLGSTDAVTSQSTDVLWYDGLTTTEIDQFTFQATPGNAIGFDVSLQDEPEPNRYVFWIGDTWLNRGIAGPSFDLYPTSP